MCIHLELLVCRKESSRSRGTSEDPKGTHVQYSIALPVTVCIDVVQPMEW